MYLLSTSHFTLITDHQTLQYAFKKIIIHGRRARWIDFLAEYDFKIQNCSGLKKYFLDHLSQLMIGENNGKDNDRSFFVIDNHGVLNIEVHLEDTLKHLTGVDMK